MKKKNRLWCMLAVMLICMTFSQKANAATVNESESNNSFATANAISSGDTVNGSITEDDEYDYYKISLPTASMVQVDFTSYMEYYSLTINDAAGEEVWNAFGNHWNSTAGYRKDLHKIYLETGTYYLKVSGLSQGTWGSKGTGKYSFLCSINNTYRNNREPDNVFAQANMVNLGNDLKGQISDNDDLDLWCFQLSVSGRVKLDITSYMENYSLAIYNTEGTEVWEKEDHRWNEDVGYRKDSYKIDLEVGTYYLEVNGFQHRTWGTKGIGTYDISTGFEASGATNSEPDNSFAQANGIVLGNTYKGQIAENDEFDTYRFSAPASGRIQIDMTSWMAYYSILIFDANGNKVWSRDDYRWNENVGYRIDKIIVELVPGTYYMQVNGYQHFDWGGRGTGVYQFRVSAKDASRVNYVLNGGTNGSNPATINGKEVSLKDARRKGYYFIGWYTDRNFQSRIYNLPEKSEDDITVYAKWEKVKVEKPKIYSVYNSKRRKLQIYYGGSYNAEGYEITYAYNKKMTSGKKVIRTSKTSRTLKKLKSRKNVYIRVRAFKYDSAGSRVYSKYSGRKKAKVR